MTTAGRATPAPGPSVMTAVRWRGRRDVRVEQVPLPDPAADEALVRVRWAGLCGSDLEEYLDGPVVVPGPVTLGHEVVGTVAVAARDGSGPEVGTVVVVDVVTGCGSCFWCRRHEEGQCPRLRVTGLHVDGGLAEYVAGRADRLVTVPSGLDPMLAALAEPTAVAVRAVRKLGPVQGRGALVSGGGTVGLLVAQVLRHQGADPVLVVEPSSARRSVAHRLGLESQWAASEAARTDGRAGRFPERGIDVVVECSGASGAAREAVRAVRSGGTVVLLGVTAGDELLDTTDAVLGEKTIIGSAAHMWDVDVAPAVGLIAGGAVEVAPLITHTVALQDGPDALALLADPESGAIKVLVGTGGPNDQAVGRRDEGKLDGGE